MNNEDKMLQLVLSDDNLCSFYKYDPKEYPNIEFALKSQIPSIVAVAKIIVGISGNSSKVLFKETYSEVFNYLNQNIL